MSWIETYTGEKYFPLNPCVQPLKIEDVAHSLALMTRYNGHCNRFYSIAEHSCRVSDLCPDELKLAGLCHDAAESVLGDVVSPIKPFTWFGDMDSGEIDVIGTFSEAEDAVLHQFTKGLVPWENFEKVKPWDYAILFYEKKYLLTGKQKWNIQPNALSRKLIRELPPLVPWSWQKSEKEFLSRWKKLTSSKAG